LGRGDVASLLVVDDKTEMKGIVVEVVVVAVTEA